MSTIASQMGKFVKTVLYSYKERFPLETVVSHTEQLPLDMPNMKITMRHNFTISI